MLIFSYSADFSVIFGDNHVKTMFRLIAKLLLILIEMLFEMLFQIMLTNIKSHFLGIARSK